MTRQQLIEQIFAKRTFLCVGLDTDTRKIPPHLLGEPDPIFAFNQAIIDATAPHCIAYKPNLAFYEAEGLAGWQAFERTVNYIHQRHPNHLIIADAKRGDIGNTANLYARTFFERTPVDALTVAPYMGEDSVTPFLQYPGKWTILLALTSNKGSLDFQTTTNPQGQPLYEQVLRKSQAWGTEENMMYVIGATRTEMLSHVRSIVPNHFLLVPGVGAQGGSLEQVCQHGMTPDCALIVNSSRAIIYADSTSTFAQTAALRAHDIHRQMDELLPRR